MISKTRSKSLWPAVLMTGVAVILGVIAIPVSAQEEKPEEQKSMITLYNQSSSSTVSGSPKFLYPSNGNFTLLRRYLLQNLFKLRIGDHAL